VSPPPELEPACKSLIAASGACRSVTEDSGVCYCSHVAQVTFESELAELAILYLAAGSDHAPAQHHHLVLRGPEGWRLLEPPLFDISLACGTALELDGAITRAALVSGGEGKAPVVSLEFEVVEIDRAPYAAGDPNAPPPEPDSPDYDISVETRITSTIFCWLADRQPVCAGLPTGGSTERYAVTPQYGGTYLKGEVKSRTTWSRPATFDDDGAIRVAPVEGTLPAGVVAAPARVAAKDALRHRAFKGWKVGRSKR